MFKRTVTLGLLYWLPIPYVLVEIFYDSARNNNNTEVRRCLAEVCSCQHTSCQLFIQTAWHTRPSDMSEFFLYFSFISHQFLTQNMCCGYSKEPSPCDSYYEPQNIFKLIWKKIFAILCSTVLLNWTYACMLSGRNITMMNIYCPEISMWADKT